MYGGMDQDSLIAQQKQAELMEQSLRALLEDEPSVAVEPGEPGEESERGLTSPLAKLSGIPDDIAITLATSTAAFSTYFLEEHVTRPFSTLHTAIFKGLDDPSLFRVALAAPRGYGKTTIADLAYVARIACFNLEPYVLIVSNTVTQAEKYLATLKQELEFNDKILAAFGKLKGPVWSSEQIVLSNGVCIQVRGAGQQVRGLKWRQFRPTVVICDDLEDKESVMSAEQRKKLKDWFYGDLMRVGHKTGQACKIVYIGTILHQDCLLENVLANDRWHRTRLEAFDSSLTPVDPSFLSAEEVKNLYDEYLQEGMLDVLYMEYRNMAVAPENRIFPIQYHRYHPGDSISRVVLEGIKNRSLVTCVLGDPAKTQNAGSDFYAIIGLAIDFQQGLIFAHEVMSERLEPASFITAMMDMADRLGTNKLFIETTSLHDWLMTVVRTVMMQRLKNGRPKIYDVTEIHSSSKAKLDRIGSLAPLYKAGSILHNAECCHKLEGQLIDYPKAKFDDVSDCMAMVIPVINQSSGWNYDSIDTLFATPGWAKLLQHTEDDEEDNWDINIAMVV